MCPQFLRPRRLAARFDYQSRICGSHLRPLSSRLLHHQGWRHIRVRVHSDHVPAGPVPWHCWQGPRLLVLVFILSGGGSSNPRNSRRGLSLGTTPAAVCASHRRVCLLPFVYIKANDEPNTRRERVWRPIFNQPNAATSSALEIVTASFVRGGEY